MYRWSCFHLREFSVFYTMNKRKSDFNHKYNTSTTKSTAAPQSPNFSFGDRIEKWSSINFRWILLLLILFWAGMRWSFYSSYQQSPLYDQYLMANMDNRFFLDWAKEISKDWWQDRSVHPYHQWHRDVAKEYFKKHPDEEIRLSITAQSDSLSAGQKLWNKWYGGKTFHQEPLYPYLLAVFIRLGFDPVNTMLLLQLALGLFSGFLLLLVTRRNFGHTAAVIAGILYLLCGILFYNEVVLLRTSWTVFFTILLVYLIDRMVDVQDKRAYAFAGIGFGFSYLLQSSFLLLMFAGILVAFVSNRTSIRVAISRVLLLFLFFTLVVSPLIIRNAVVGVPLFSVSSVGPVTFIIPNANPSISYASWYPQPEVHTELISLGYRNMTDAISITMRTHTGISSYLHLLYLKAQVLWIGYEYPNNENFYLYRSNFHQLRLAFFDFFLIAPLAAAGVLLAVYKKKRTYGLYSSLVFHIALMLAFYVLARFRAPLVLVCIPYASFTLTEIIKWKRGQGRLLLAVLAASTFLLFSSYKNYSPNTEDRFLDGAAYRAVYEVRLEKQLKDLYEREEWNEWLKYQKKFYSIEPEFIQNISQLEVRTSKERVSIASFFLELHQERMEVMQKSGLVGEASAERAKVEALNHFIGRSIDVLGETNRTGSDRVRILNDFATSSYKQKNYEAAIHSSRQALSILPDQIQATYMIGLCHLEQGAYDSSTTYFKRVLEQDRDHIKSLVGMTAAYFFQRKYAQAIPTTKHAIELRPREGDFYANLAACYMNTGQLDSAIYWLRKGISVSPTKRTYEYISNCFKAQGLKDSSEFYADKVNR